MTEYSFEFEVRKSSGGNRSDAAPPYAAVRISQHADKTPDSKRFYFSFNVEAMALGKWVRGDRIIIGADTVKGVLCFKRDPAGYCLSGRGSQRHKTKASFVQATFRNESKVLTLVQHVMGDWIPLSDHGIFLVTNGLLEPQS